MATVRDYVRDNFPETFEVLKSQSYGGEGDGDNLIDRTIGLAASGIVVAGTDLDTLHEAVKSYLADIATRRLILAGIDYYQVKTRRSDSLDRAPGVTPLGGERSENYDRVRGLQELDRLIAVRIQRDADQVSVLAGAAFIANAVMLHSSVPKVSSSVSDMRSQDPDSMDRITRSPRYGVSPFGGGYYGDF